ncbi:MAG: recombination mediator RecR [Acidimicrobiales bacterium]
MYTGALQALIDELGRLPGVGPKSAQRIAFHLLKVPEHEALRLSDAIVSVKERTVVCSACFNVAERGSQCEICLDESRDAGILCVVEEPQAVVAFERTKEFKGRYHVLGGALNPLEGIGPDQLRIKELVERVQSGAVTEVVLSTNPNLEGETTAMYVARRLSELPVRVTRLASGLPAGGDLEYADELTLGRALEGRRELKG